jgi:hypothetical protein
LLGQLRYPDGSYNYSYANGSVVELQCTAPLSNLTQALLVKVDCEAPLILGPNGQCQIPCPFPMFDAGQQGMIQSAFVVPALIGLVLCVFVLMDSIWVVAEARGARLSICCLTRFVAGPSGAGSSSVGAPNSGSGTGGTGVRSGVHRRQVRASTLYALVGSLLGIVYFVIGPLATMMHASDISCSSPTLDFNVLFSGTSAEPTSCVAQRASPFVLQAIFNLILYAMVRVYLVVDSDAKRMGEGTKKALDVILMLYCVGLPILALIVAMSLDQLSTDLLTGLAQLARQSTICQVRLPQAVEIVLVYVPFILTGFIVTTFAVLILARLRSIRKKVGGTKQGRSASDVALHLLIARLSILGLATFLVLIILMSTTSVFQSQLTLYGPAFDAFFACQIVGFACLDCPGKAATALALLPSPRVVTTQVASMSCIMLLFGCFFGAQSVSRLYKEFLDGTLQSKMRYFVRGGAQPQSSVGKALSNNAGTAVMSGEEPVEEQSPRRPESEKRVAPAAYMAASDGA